jgi:DNA polymerase III alpha subunit (gram-positive type)
MVADAPSIETIRENIHPLFVDADVHVAHNHAFDDRILTQEIRRVKLEKLHKRPIYCTMRESVDIVRISNGR